ncbi:Acylphosphatase [Grifola frondosa]|uniref:Acylphosphatase n=1 Tax=Grifola frondosa TaxID=5627 RepID=A0A1C7LXY4_GRIFR|nr:Acylphosphatase [Grifola frondosa]
MANQTFHFLVSGKVQGVGFRAFTRRIAREEGVVGWVRNDSRGNVVGVAQGSEHALSNLTRSSLDRAMLPWKASSFGMKILLEPWSIGNLRSGGDILHRGLVYSLFGITLWGIYQIGSVHRDTLRRGRGRRGARSAIAEGKGGGDERDGTCGSRAGGAQRAGKIVVELSGGVLLSDCS